MKKVFFLVLAALTFACCAKDSGSKTLYITSSKGAFNGEKTQQILPKEAKVVINSISSTNASLNISYSWSGIISFAIEVPSTAISGSLTDFTISAENVPARCNMVFHQDDYKDVTLNISGYYKKAAKSKPFHLVITPTDNAACPYLEIDEVSEKHVDLQPGGANVDYYLSKEVFNNLLTVPITIKWKDVFTPEYKTFTIDSNKSTWYWEEDALPIEGLSESIVIAEGKEYLVNFLKEGNFSRQACSEFHFHAGEPQDHRYELYTFNITPELLSTAE